MRWIGVHWGTAMLLHCLPMKIRKMWLAIPHVQKLYIYMLLSKLWHVSFRKMWLAIPHVQKLYIYMLLSKLQHISFSCFHKQSKIKKCFFNFPRPNHYTKRLKDNPKNVSLPMKADKYLWKLANLLREDHFVPDNHNQTNSTFASVNDHHHPNLDQSSYCVCCRFSCLTQWQSQTNTSYII